MLKEIATKDIKVYMHKALRKGEVVLSCPTERMAGLLRRRVYYIRIADRRASKKYTGLYESEFDKLSIDLQGTKLRLYVNTILLSEEER